MPPNMTIKEATITASVARAVLTTGSRKARTPLLTASTPVIAVHPLEKAFKRSQRLTAAAADAGGAGGATSGDG